MKLGSGKWDVASTIGQSAELGLEPPGHTHNPRVATFFAVYPETLGLSDGATFSAALNEPLVGFARTAMHLAEGKPHYWLDPMLSGTLAVSVRFHRRRRGEHAVILDEDLLVSLTKSVIGTSFPELANSTEDASREHSAETIAAGIREFTIIEVSTQVAMPEKAHWQACEPNDYIMGPTLTRCLDCLMMIIDAYRYTEKVSIPSPARERFGPVIVAATRAADPDQGGWDPLAGIVFNYFAVQKPGSFIAGPHNPDTFAKMSEYFRAVALGHPAIEIGHLQSEMDNALHHDGNFRAVLLFAHSVGEILMDAALMAMLFEEGKSPADAAIRFRKPFKTRLLTEYHDRLGGAWSPRGPNVVATWLHDILRIRHRVAHAGYAPHYEEARLARDAHYALGTYLRDRLAERIRQYPFANGMLVTKNGFERRGIRTKAASEAVKLTEERLSDFVAWRNEVIALRDS